MKSCNKCLNFLPLKCFGVLKKSKDGFRPICKECRNLITKKAYSENPQPFIKRKNEWKKNNPESYRQSNKKYYLNNLDKIKNYAKENRENINENHRRWVSKNKIKESKRLYEIHKFKRQNDYAFRLRLNISRDIRRILKKQNTTKNNSTWSKLPYTPQQLKEHLEQQFDQHMTWKNYGKYWNIDHIYPQSKLLYNSMDHPNFKKSWALENLRPLEKIANIKKGNKIK